MKSWISCVFLLLFFSFRAEGQAPSATPRLSPPPISLQHRELDSTQLSVDAGASITVAGLTVTNIAVVTGQATPTGYSWTKASGPGVLTFNPVNKGTNVASASVAGTYNLEVDVYVGNNYRRGFRTVTFGGVTVDAPPTISTMANVSTNEDFGIPSVPFTIGDDITPPGSLTVLAVVTSGTNVLLNSGVAVNGSGASRFLTLTPRPNSNGVATISVSVTDGNGRTTSGTVQATWAGQNDQPILASIGTQNTTEDVAKVVNLSATDVESTPTFSATSNDQTLLPASGMSIVGNVMTLTPAANRFGTNTVVVTASDGSGGIDSETITFGVASQNDVPTITNPSDPNPFQVGQPFDVAYVAFDIEDGGNMTYTRATDNPGVVPLANIVLSTGTSSNRIATITGAAPGTANVTLTAQDSAGASVQTVIAVTISGTPNTDPSITPPGNVTVFKNQPTGTLNATVSDGQTPAGQLVLWAALSSNPALIPTNRVVITGSTGTRNIVASPISNVTGSATITLQVRDGGGAEAAASFTVTVSPTNYPPVMSQPPTQSMNEDGTITVQVTLSDSDTALASIATSGSSSNPSLVGNPPSSGTGAIRTFTITPLANQNGSATITLSANDGATVSQVAFSLTVFASNDSPTMTALSDQTVAINTASSQPTTVADLETPGSLTLSGTSSNGQLVPNGNITFSGSGASRNVIVTPATGQSGSAVITVVVNDGQGGTSSRTFNFVVTPAGGGRTFYASASGSSGNSGLTTSSPWDLNSIGSPGPKGLQGGDTVWILAGKFNGAFTFSGNYSSEIKFRGLNRPYPNSQAARFDRNLDRDGQAAVTINGQNITLEDLVFENTAARVEGFDRPEAINTRGSRSGVKVIGSVVRNGGNGIGFQDTDENVAGNIEASGIITYYNGYCRNGDCNHGHGVYNQMKGPGSMTMRDIVSFQNLGQGHQFSGTELLVLRNYTVEGYMSFMNGPPGGTATREILLGFANKLRDITFRSNFAYYVLGGSVGTALGYPGGSETTAFNTNVLQTGCWVMGRGGFWQRWHGATITNNLFFNPAGEAMDFDSEPPNTSNVEDRNFLYGSSNPYSRDGTRMTKAQWTAATGYGANDVVSSGIPPDIKIVRRHVYNPKRAFIWIYNGNAQAATVTADLSSVLSANDNYEIRYVGNLQSVHTSGVATTPNMVSIPMTGFTMEPIVGPTPNAPQPTTRELGVFVLDKTN